MPIFPYLTDNPFRMLGLSASTHSAVLGGYHRLIAGGILPLSTPQILPDVFGVVDAALCLEQIRRAQTDPVLRTLFRLFWPLDDGWADREQGKRCIRRSAILDLRIDAAEADTSPTVRQRQRTLIQDWIVCTQMLDTLMLGRERVDSRLDSLAGIILNEFKRLRSTPCFVTLFTDLLIAEGEAEPHAIAATALAQARDVIVSSMVRAFVAEWERGGCFTLLKAIDAQEGWEHLAPTLFADVIALGQQEKRRIDHLAAHYSGWRRLDEIIGSRRPSRNSLTGFASWMNGRQEDIVKDLAEVDRLYWLAAVGGGILPVVEWFSSVRNYASLVAASMLKQADGFAAEERTYADALEILWGIVSRRGCVDDTLMRKVDAEIARLEVANKQSGSR